MHGKRKREIIRRKTRQRFFAPLNQRNVFGRKIFAESGIQELLRALKAVKIEVKGLQAVGKRVGFEQGKGRAFDAAANAESAQEGAGRSGFPGAEVSLQAHVQAAFGNIGRLGLHGGGQAASETLRGFDIGEKNLCCIHFCYYRGNDCNSQNTACLVF